MYLFAFKRRKYALLITLQRLDKIKNLQNHGATACKLLAKKAQIWLE